MTSSDRLHLWKAGSRLLALSLLSVTIAACGGGGERTEDVAQSTSGAAERTVASESGAISIEAAEKQLECDTEFSVVSDYQNDFSPTRSDGSKIAKRTPEDLAQRWITKPSSSTEKDSAGRVANRPTFIYEGGDKDTARIARIDISNEAGKLKSVLVAKKINDQWFMEQSVSCSKPGPKNVPDDDTGYPKGG